MPRGKKMQTPSKEPEISSMTHEEEEKFYMIYQNYKNKCNKCHAHKS